MKYKSIYHPDHLYFLSTQVAEWKHIFYLSQYAEIPLNSLDYLRKNGYIKLFAFCLMPNHIHYLIKPLKDFAVSRIVARFNSYSAHEILELARKEDRKDWLELFSNLAQRDADRNYRIWGDTLDRNIDNPNSLERVLEYIHNNPTNKGWQLVEDRVDYPYSSACFYDLGKDPIIKVDDAREIWD